MNNKLVEELQKTVLESFESQNKKLYQYEKNKFYAYLGEYVLKLFKKHDVFIAGGAITSLFTNSEINDIDVYFRNEKSLISFLKDCWQSNDTWVVTLTKKSVLLKIEDLNIQLIHFKYFKDAEDIFNSFDFTVCMGAFDFNTEQFVLHEQFLKHNSQRHLKFNKQTDFPIVSLLRVQKYTNKNYRISKPEFIRIILRCMTLEIKTIEGLKNHLGGMYGINYDKIIQLDQDEEFSLGLVIDKIADVALSEDYFKEPEKIKFDDLDTVIENIQKKEAKILKVNNNTYKLLQNNTLKKINFEPLNYKIIDNEEYFKNKRFYKFVTKKDHGEYVSHFDSSFEYTNNKESTARGDYLYLVEKSELKKATYFDKGVLIEVSVKPEDFINKDHNNILAKTCKTIREVNKNEWEAWVNEDDKLSENLDEDDSWGFE